MHAAQEKSIAIITSATDPAGASIKVQLLKNYGFEEVKGQKFDGFEIYSLPVEDYEARLYTLSTDSIHCENIDKCITANLFVFATRHRSEAGIPALTAHAIGNWGKADYGGKDSTVCQTSPSLLKLFIQNLAAVAKSEGYTGEVMQESTHHGPFIEKPAVFIELGSSELQWKDAKLASMVADSLIGGLGDYVVLDEIRAHVSVVGIGGSHYAREFTKLMLGSNYAVGHICPKHHLASLTPELLQQALDACSPKATAVALDWKGLGSEKQRITQMLENGKIKYFKA